MTVRTELDALDIEELARIRQLARSRRAPARTQAIPRLPRHGLLAPSFAQQRLWFLDQLDGSSHYHVPFGLQLDGALDVVALRASLDALLARHEVLRSRFVMRDGQPWVALAGPDTRFALLEHDLRGDPDDVWRLSTEEGETPFDLANGPLVRGRLLRVSDDRHVLLVTMHHIVTDGWSSGIFLAELGVLYRAFRAGEGDPLPPLEIQYADYAGWQREWLSGERLEEQLGYWREQLDGAPVLLDLPVDRRRPAQQSFDGASVDVVVDGELTAQLKELSRRHGATLYMVLLAAWSLVLSRLSGQPDVVIGTPTANRNRREIEPLIGFFVNTLAMRIDLSGEPSVSDLLEAVRRTVLGAQDHQDLPFEQVVELLQPPRRLSHTPLFQVMFAWQNNAIGQPQLDGVGAAPFGARGELAMFDLELGLAEYGGEIAGVLSYATALFDAATIERHRGYLVEVLRAMVAEPGQAVSRIDILSDAERTLLLDTWNRTDAVFPADRCIHELFAEQARNTPDAIAIVHDGIRLTYGALEARANGLALDLRSRGVKRGDRVVTILERGIDLVVAQLAILKCAAAYVPVDPESPRARQEWIARDCAARVVLTEVGETTGSDPCVSADAEDVAYVMYTSGSTGTPKGVEVPHRAVNRLVINGGYAEIVPRDRVAWLGNPAFDISTFEVWAPLLHGARLVVVPRATVLRYEALRELVVNEIDVLHLTAGLFREAVPVLGDALRGLRLLLTGGDFVDPSTTATVLRDFPPQRLVHCYGPTESTTFATTSTVTESDGRSRLPIGRPIANTRIYLLDRHRQPVPLGTVGELYIGGAGIALGYLDRPELTAERFLEDPFRPGWRMYRTGDLARYRGDGDLELLGRDDDQVKIRGYRIELGEIEAQLGQHPAVRESVVVAREEEGGKRLVAYVVPAQEPFDAAALRADLAGQLPDYMVPSAFVAMPSLPLTPNGKHDRRALPEPARQALQRAFAPPQGEREELLAAIWEELLKVERVGRYDDFFELGGHSLLAVQVIERLRRLRLGATVRDLFDRPGLAAFASTLGDSAYAAVPSNVITMETKAIVPELLPLIELRQEEIDRIVADVPGGVANIQDIYALSPLQEGILFHHLLETEDDPYLLRSELAFPSRERLDRFVAAVQQVVDRHDILRTSIHWEGLSKAAQVVWRHAVLLVIEGGTPQPRIALTRAPLMRFLIREEPERGRWVLVIQQHHLIGDHSTMEVMHGEVSAILAGRAETLEAPQPFRNLVAQARLGLPAEEHERFFRTMLEGIEEPTLPFGLADVRRDGKGVSQSRRLIAESLNERLRSQARRLGVSVASLCHLAWGQVLARTSGREEVVFGTVLFGRNEGGEGVERAMGLFINTLPIRLNLDDTPIEESVRRTHRRLAELLRHEHASLALAQRCSGVAAPLPLFSALLNYRHNPVPAEGAEGPLGDIEWIGGHERTNYPISLSIDDFGEALGLTARVVSGVAVEGVLDRMERALGDLAEKLEHAPRSPVRELDVLPPAERTLLVDTWNATEAPYPDDRTIQALFEEQVRRTPDAPAVVQDERALTYAELNAQANRLAHRLIASGVKTEDRVALCVERGPGLVIGILGIWKAGGAYVPLDPGNPRERLEEVLRDAEVAALVGDEAAREALGERPMLDVASSEGDERNPEVDVEGGNLAYVLYTSGSSGKPKGVMVEHRSVANLWTALEATIYRGRDHVRVGWNASFQFDASVKALVQLLSGRCLVMLPSRVRTSGEAFMNYLRTHRVEVIDCTPSQLGLLLPFEALEDKAEEWPKAILIGGEAIAGETWRRLAAIGHRESYNVYGPTECTVDVTAAKLGESDEPTLGCPLANVRIYLLDGHQRPVPIGVPGEVYIGGAGVARGYWKREALTAERFVATSFGRLYRTGDLARHRPDGAIESLGRNDEQIKIRGVRIEPGEIEARLREHAGVHDCVVVAREDALLEKRLVAYVVGEAEAGSLREHLSRQLPDTMIPAAFVMLDRLPLTRNGKLDRKALPAPDATSLVRSDYEPPVTATERMLATLWSELLGVERVGRQDDFFALGGHSLLAVRLLERLRRAGLATSIRDLFDHPTLAAFAATAGGEREVVVPPNVLRSDTTTITPSMLPLATLTDAEIARIVASVPGGVANIQDIYGLSPLQEGILFHHLLATEGDPYLLISQMAFAGREGLDRFVAAVQQVVDRHDILRTAVHWNGLVKPAQVVWRRAPLSVVDVELEPDGASAAEQLAHRFDPRQFRIDLTQAPLLRFYAARDPESGRWLLLELQHHLIGDHSTVEVMHAEVASILSGRHDLLQPPQPFRNLVAQARLGVSREEHEQFFREMLGDVDEPSLPFGLSDVRHDGIGVVEVARMLPGALNDRLRAQARRLGVSLASLCHLAWGQVIARTSGREQVVFGTVLFGRMQAGEGSDRAMGLFINTLPIRLDLDDTPLEESVRRTHRRLAQLLRHEHAPLALAQQCSGIAAPAPLFSSLLNYRHNRVPAERETEATNPFEGIEWMGGEERTNYPVCLSVDDFGEAIGLTAQVVNSLPAERICELMQRALEDLSERLDREPRTPVRDLDVLPPAERELLVDVWNRTSRPYPADRCIHELFAEQARARPNALAAVAGTVELTYGSLEARANALAQTLRTRGVRRGDRVATVFDRGIELLIAQLAVLKCGAAYLPIDPQTPQARQEWLVEDCAARLVLTATDVVAADRLASSVADASEAADAGDAAYVMYTSGSTGLPKGVIVPHRGVVRLVRNNGYADFTATDRVAFAASPAFDAATLEVWAALLNGGCVIVAASDDVLDPQRFGSLLARHGVTVLWLTAGLFSQYAEALAPQFASLRYLIVGGDVVDPRAIDHVWQQRPLHLLNGYGPTETTTFAATYEIERWDGGMRSIPIGRPIGNTTIFILDGRGTPVPIGVKGELYIGGAGVAQGYLNRPELTAERFVHDPFAPSAGARMYRTGDFGRWCADGTIEFLGRADGQVKIRGYRIELGEIEARLTEQPGVADAVVLAREEAPGGKRLVAYVVPKLDARLEPAELRAQLAARLPEPMLPAAFVVMERLPLTANGKLDRNALPAPDGAEVARGEYDAPRGEIEETLAAIWSEVLRLERVGRDDNFFALGGHSLLAVQLFEHLRRASLGGTSIRDLFDHPTLAAFAATVGSHREVVVPPNAITTETTTLTPDLLPLITLAQPEIDHLVTQIPGGVANIQDVYALSPLQDGILFHHLLATEGDPYLLVSQMTFPNRARFDELLGAVQQLVDRHDILRTSIHWEGLSVPAQVVWRHAPLPVTELELDPAAGDLGEQLLRRFDPRHYRIDLTRAPLMRYFAACEPGSDRWFVVELQHHLVVDHSAMDVMHGEVVSILSGRGETLEQPHPFRNLVAQTRLGRSAEEHRIFFRDMLGDIDEPTLPFGLAEVHRDGGDVVGASRMLSDAANDRLRRQARRLGVSLASLCHLAWGQVVARTSGRESVVFGTVLFGRTDGHGGNRALGLFINTLPIRLDLDDTPVEESARRAHRRVAALLRHEHASLAMAQQCSGVLSPAPLFSSLLNYRHNEYRHNEPQRATSGSEDARDPFEGIEWRGGEERTNYPITVAVDDYGEALRVSAQVVSNVSAERVCDLMQRALEDLAESLEKAPRRPVRELDVLSAAERTLLLETWNATGAPFDAGLCVHERFEQQVRRDPGATAVTENGIARTYGELNAYANRLARRLAARGVRHGDRVVTLLERGLGLIAAKLSILKCGAAYVPIDPQAPVARQQWIIDDCAARLVLRTPDLEVDSGDGADLSMEVASGDVAYVMYTSGSTGTPKGVEVPHRAVMNFALNERGLDVRPDDRIAWTANPAFDASTFEVWTALLRGACVVIVAREALLEGGVLRTLIVEERVTVLQLVAGLLAAHVEPLAEVLPRLRYLVTGGDVADPRAIARALEAGTSHLLQTYGPTETTTFATACELTEVGGGPIPIGRPIANTRIYLLDEQCRPVPLGVAGELYIGGAGVARGYLNRPELTAARFLDDPFMPGGRMYRTGDLARYRSDGNLDFLGRNDQQIKLRGFRIELGEIEARLAEHSDVRESVVVARADDGGEKRLVAYVVPSQGSLDLARLRAHLASQLPDYMVPAAFVTMERLPLNENGKLDRKALPAPDAAEVVRRAWEAPRGEVEQALATIWNELLKVPGVGRDDHFLELGGHSLLAMRLVSRLQQRLGVTLPLTAVFAQPVLRAMAEEVTRRRPVGEAVRVPSISVVPRDEPLPLSFAQQRLWFLDQLRGPSSDGASGASTQYHVPFGLHLEGELHVAALHAALDRLMARHESLRSRFVNHGGEPRVELMPAGCGFTLVEHDLSDDPVAETRLQELTGEEARTPFDLAKGPPVRGRLIRLSADRHVLLVTHHHIVTDGWSMGIFLDELATLYRAFRDDQPDPLPPLAIQVPDYAAWLRDWMTGERLQEHAEYWRTRLADAPLLLELPIDRPRPAHQSFDGAEVEVLVDSELTRQLEGVAQQAGTSLFVVLLGAWAFVLSRLAGQEEVVIGTPVANRGRREVEPLIGFFVNTLALRLDPGVEGSAEGSAITFFEHVRRAVLEGQEHQDLPFEQVVELLRPPRSLAHTPLFQAIFTFEDSGGGELDLPALRVTPFGAPTDRVRFDLELGLGKHEGCIAGRLGYATALFDAATVERQRDLLLTVLRAFAADPSQSLSQIDLLSPAERTTVLETWNRTATPYPAHRPIHDLFEEQARATPDEIAVVQGRHSLTYAGLDARANLWALRLIARGVRRGDRVATRFERSIDLVVAQLAVLKCGAAYVPIDPQVPEARQQWIIEDCAAAVVLTGLDEAFDPGSEPSASSIATLPRVDAGDAAYVMYTSGSTGEPKGVIVPHRGVVRLVRNNGYADFRASDRFAFAASPAFDASTLEVWAPLLNGGRLVVVAAEEVLDAERFRDVLMRHEVTVLWLTAGLFAQSVETLGPAFSKLRYLLVGGDVVDPRAVDEVLRHHRPEHVLNGYGPTETTTFAATHEIVHGNHELSRIPIGRPIGNTSIYILDRRRAPVPIGMKGELYVGGDGVALGYLDRPEMTAVLFVDNPFHGGRMYRTGDFGRWLPGGTIEFLGRGDSQVKIRGYRIEPGEIEACLGAHPDVADVAVLAREDLPGEKRLVAYIVPKFPVPLDPANVRAYLARHLPEAMIPSAFVVMDRFPLTVNGKLDRRLLPPPGDEAVPRSAYEEPQGEIEQALASVWSELLKLERIGRHDDFFEIGGHSLLVVQLVARLRQLGFDVAVETLFAAPRLAAFAQRMATPSANDLLSGAVPVRAGGSEAPLFFVPSGLGDYSYVYALAPSVDPSIPIWALPWQPAGEPLFRTLEAMAARMVVMIRQVQPDGPYRLAGYSSGGLLAYAVARHLLGIGSDVAFLGLIDVAVPQAAAPQPLSGPDGEGLDARHEAYHAAYLAYRPEPIPLPVDLIAATEALDETLGREPSLGWNVVLPVAIHRVPGNHFTMMNVEANRKEVGRCLTNLIHSRKTLMVHEPPAGLPILLRGSKSLLPPIICVPGAGDGVTSFADFARSAGIDRNLYGVQPRGIERGELPHVSVEAAAAFHLDSLRRAGLGDALHLVGHSHGGLVAFEMARRLREAGRVVLSLTLIDVDPPATDPAAIEDLPNGEIFRAFARSIELRFQKPLDLEPLRFMTSDAFLAYLHTRIVALGIVPSRSTPQLLHGPFATYAAALRCVYHPATLYPGRCRLITVSDPSLPPEEDQHRRAQAVATWRTFAADLEVAAGPGNHFTILASPHVEWLGGWWSDVPE